MPGSNGGPDSTRLGPLLCSSRNIFCGLGSPGMNSLSTPNEHFLSVARGSLIGSGLPWVTPSRMSPHVISLVPHPAVMQGGPIRRKRGRLLKHGRGSAVSSALLPSTSCPVPIARPTEKRRGRSPGTGQKLHLVSLDEQDRHWQRLVPRVFTIAAGEDVRREILLFAQRHHATVVLSGFGAISAINVATQGSLRTITRQGYFSIISLVGSYRQNYNSPHGLDGGLSVSLADRNGHIIGGRVEQFMVAVEPVQVVVGTF